MTLTEAISCMIVTAVMRSLSTSLRIKSLITPAKGTAAAQGEPLQILRYRPGQEYKPHSDALPGEANQRILTMLVYLNDGYRGGETLFLANRLKVRGEVGDALLFRNVDCDNRPDRNAVHAGLPVTSGEKFLRHPLDPLRAVAAGA